MNLRELRLHSRNRQVIFVCNLYLTLSKLFFLQFFYDFVKNVEAFLLS